MTCHCRFICCKKYVTVMGDMTLEEALHEWRQGMYGKSLHLPVSFVHEPKTALKSCRCLVTTSCLTLATPWTVACQAPVSMGFSRQEYWSGLPFPSPGVQSCPTLCDPVDYSLPGSCVHGILQARIMEWVAMPFSPV